MKAKWTAAMLAASLAAAVAGCSNSGDSSDSVGSPKPSATGGASEAAAPADPFSPFKDTVTIAIGRDVFDKKLPNGDTLESNAYTRYIEQKLNVKLKFDWVIKGYPTDKTSPYYQKVNLAITSKQMPDTMLVDEKQLKMLVEADMIADLTDVYNKYASPLVKDYVQSYGKRGLDTSTFNGKLMAIPDLNIGEQHEILWIRKDWMDKLGLQPPKTLDDVLAIAQAFVDKNPGGQEGSVGFPVVSLGGSYNNFLGMDPVFGYYKAFPKQWMKTPSGEIGYGSIAPETKTALAKIRDMYANGLIDKQFAVRKFEDSLGLLNSGKAGLIFAPWWGPLAFGDAVKNDPKVEWLPIAAPLDAEGKFNVYTQDPHAAYMVVKKGVAHPEAIMKVYNWQLRMMRHQEPEAEKLYDTKDVNISADWGIFPFHINMAYEDAVKRNNAALVQAIKNQNPSGLDPENVSNYNTYLDVQKNGKADLGKWNSNMSYVVGAEAGTKNNVNHVVNAFFGMTKTMETKWANLQKLEGEAFLKIVLGEWKIEKFDEFVSEWKRLGGDEITKEVNDAVKNK